MPDQPKPEKELDPSDPPTVTALVGLLDHGLETSGLTRAQFASALDVRDSVVDGWWSGRSVPERPAVRRIAVLLGLEPAAVQAAILDGDGPD